MSKIFSKASLEGKLLLLSFLMEQEESVNLDFGKEGHEYFRKKYPKYYQHCILLGVDNEIHLIASLEEIDKKKAVITVFKLEYNSGCADTTYDDSSITKYRNGAYPKGITMKIPVQVLKGIQPFGKKYHRK